MCHLAHRPGCKLCASHTQFCMCMHGISCPHAACLLGLPMCNVIFLCSVMLSSCLVPASSGCVQWHLNMSTSQYHTGMYMISCQLMCSCILHIYAYYCIILACSFMPVNSIAHANSIVHVCSILPVCSIMCANSIMPVFMQLCVCVQVNSSLLYCVPEPHLQKCQVVESEN